MNTSQRNGRLSHAQAVALYRTAQNMQGVSGALSQIVRRFVMCGAVFLARRYACALAAHLLPNGCKRRQPGHGRVDGFAAVRHNSVDVEYVTAH
jgi:hypothetical protein